MFLNSMVRVRPACVSAWFALILSLSLGSAAQAELTLEHAESLALSADPAAQRFDSESQALQALAIAAGELPDPMARLGFMSLPVDSFNLGQEAMTQVVAGVVQRFPRGDTRSLEQRRLRERASGQDHAAADQRLLTVLSVRERYLEVVLQQRLQTLTGTARSVFAGLADITRDYYATGRAQQQDVLQASVELARIEERALQYEQREHEARAELAAFVGPAAHDELTSAWPILPEVPAAGELKAALAEHPRLLALQQQVLAAETGVDLADERYRPEFAVDVSYGLRSGSDPQGVSRPDLFSAMVVMDLPFFHEKRQDQVKAARLAESSATAYRRDDTWRKLRADLERSLAALKTVEQRRELFESVLLPQAEFSAEASFEAYQSAVGDLTGLLRARIAEYELGLDHARVQAEVLRLRARLLYLGGETP
ncbi:TolC family protein [Elongatibacter sediminis]|uniref:TolC family protein n=1 Tax=Elongatibacter sediminis TaxID=3119006 RepID=A0AAW9R9Y6_9GAMM